MLKNANLFISELNRRPWLISLLGTISLVLGIITQSYYFLWLPAIPFFLKKISLKAKLVVVFLFYAGFFIAGHSNQDIQIPTERGALSGTIIDTNENNMRQFPYSYKVDGKFCGCRGRYLLYSKDNLDLTCGDFASFYGLKPSSTNSADFKKYLNREGVASTFFSRGSKFKVKKQDKTNLMHILNQLKTGLARTIKDKLSPQAFCLFSSIFLGNRSECAREHEELRPLFKYWGLSHLLARSGLHLIIFIATISMLLSLAASFYTRQAIQALLVIAYYLLSWPSASFNRALVFFILWQTSNMLRLQRSSINLLNIVTISALLINPVLIFFLDFQLSFIFAYALAFLFESNLLLRQNS